MGTWDSGNFDNDTSADYLSDITGNWIKEIEDAMENPVELEPDEFWGNAVPCAIDLLVMVAEKKVCGAMLPELEDAKRWKSVFIDVWEGYIDELDPDEDYKEDRRKVLHDTFDKLIALCAEREKE